MPPLAELVIDEFSINAIPLHQAMESVAGKLQEDYGAVISVKFYGKNSQRARQIGNTETTFTLRLTNVSLRKALRYLADLSKTHISLQPGFIIVDYAAEPRNGEATPEQLSPEEIRHRNEQLENTVIEDFSIERLPLTEALMALNEQLMSQNQPTFTLGIRAKDRDHLAPLVSHQCQSCSVVEIIDALRRQAGAKLEFQGHALLYDPRNPYIEHLTAPELLDFLWRAPTRMVPDGPAKEELKSQLRDYTPHSLKRLAVITDNLIVGHAGTKGVDDPYFELFWFTLEAIAEHPGSSRQEKLEALDYINARIPLDAGRSLRMKEYYSKIPMDRETRQ